MATTGLLPAVDADVARVTEALHMITPRWNVRILLALNQPPQRYTQIANKLPYLHSGQLHPKVRSLCDAGLVERTEHSAHHVTYHLTQRGRQLLPVLGAIAAWAEEYLEKPEQPLSAIEQTEDSLTLLTRRQAPAILWVLKARQEASARALARIVIPDGYWTSIYPPLRQLIDDGLVVTAGKGRPYRLSPGGDGLGHVFGALSMWAAGRPVDHAARHPLWGRPEPSATTAPGRWISHQSRPAARSARPAPAEHRPTWQSGDLFSHSTPARPTPALPTASGVRR
ncbi:winged helix-turn-helix transcriptional regulator [Streptomyces sp. SP18BB07]|uniref:winged helix-turn-helix transcriptional regulator n=1 Tax=Streptomyces sp. SP18BB07 TaxID=3002522 RepID=UPI002E775D16|nr:helix-turn-helix domain-containing protein [Streptomyces sp. SP18BB07]MEE1765318.1 helix-turn-helix domain-containing protein [Streptomyces sp. SP18BB07]